MQYQREDEFDKAIEISEALSNFARLGRQFLLEEEGFDEFQEAVENLREVVGNRKYVVGTVPNSEGEQTTYLLSSESIDDLENVFSDPDYFITEGGSDAEFVERIIDPSSSILEDPIAYATEFRPRKNRGSYFKYVHNVKDINLHRFQILHKNDNIEIFKRVNAEHCFVNSVQEYIEEYYQNEEREYLITFVKLLRLRIGTEGFKIGLIPKLLNEENFKDINIYIKKYNDDMTTIKNKKSVKYPMNEKFKRKYAIKLILFRDHYMPFIKTNFNVTKITGKRNKDYIKSDITMVLRKLLEYNCLSLSEFNVKRDIEMEDNILDEINISIEQDIKSPDYVLYEDSDNLEEEYELSQKTKIYFCDFESVVSGVDYHKPFLIGLVDVKGNFKSFSSVQIDNINRCSLITSAFDYMIKNNPKTKNFNLYFHNLKYDFTFIKRNPYITITRELNRANQVYSVSITYIKNKKKRYFKLIDSYKIIPKALGDFGNAFPEINYKKMKFEIYDYFTLDSIKRPMIRVEDYKEYLKSKNIEYDEKDYEDFLVIRKNKYLKIKDYYINYLKYDCLTLMDGMRIFNKLMVQVTGLSVYHYLTISSLSNAYLHKEGCYDGVYSVTGNTQAFINKAVIGGRVCLRDNKKVDVSEAIEDYDGVSLYPSSMKLVKIPRGKCETIKSKDYNYIKNNYSNFILSLKIKLNKHQQIPMLSILEKVSSKTYKRHWISNLDMIYEVHLDKTAIEDLIEFQKAEIVEITTGVGWPKENGENNKINEIIQNLFRRRLEAKKDKNTSLSEILKLLMNSAYGKTLLKDSDSEIIYKRSKNEMLKYVYNNYASIKRIELITPKEEDEYKSYRIIVKKGIIGNYNLAHVGCFILSMSKRIMNKVLNVANDNDIPVYYTDTDSMHLRQKDVPKLEQLYQEKYNEKITGNQLGQFHTDFNPSSRDVSPVGLHSKRFIGLGKKCYLDILTNKEGQTDYHIRFKGANSKNIKEYCKDEKIDIVEFYERLYKGEPVYVDIAKGKVRFEYINNKVKTKNEFIKKFQFH